MLNVDLHCHSRVSDGTLAPAELAARAKSNGVDLWAMTDHDEVGGIAEARQAAAELELPFVAGVEISITWSGQTVHIVGLRIDENNRALIDGLAAMRGGREQRAREVAERLDAIGVPDAYAGALKYVGNPDLISRTHFARYLMEIGLCESLQDVFGKYLGEGKPGYVTHRWATLRQAMDWIHGAGGIAVIAHPGRYKFSELQFDELFREFKELGGNAIEVITGSHTVDQYDTYAKIANKYGFLASRGSDFHGPGESRIDLGALPPLPAGVTPVWRDWDLSA
jgi:predicted metal-dependent phosphoesterase TrpH